MTIDPSGAQLAAQGVAFAPDIAAAARRHGLDPELLAAVAAQETGGPDSNAGRNVIGDGGHGHGLFQIDDRWHAFAKTAAAMDPARNADYAAGMLSKLLGRYGGDVRKALSAYNAGSPNAEGTLTRWGDGRTLGYADSVLRHYRRLSGSPAPAGPLGEATAEVHASIGALGALGSLAGCLPPRLPPIGYGSHAPHYRRQTTDYAQLFDDDSSST